MSSSLYWKAGAVLASSSIALASFGAHGLPKIIGNDQARAKSWGIGTNYQMIHGFALLFVSSIPKSVRVLHPATKPLFLGGTVLFSGSIYLVTLKPERPRIFSPFAPLGGLALMAAWASLLL